MIEWVKKIFGQSSSSATAKERLRLVLMTDHLALAPEIIEQMKHDLVEVISRYVEVDQEKVEVNFEREDKALAMLANIPIRAVNRPVNVGDVKPNGPDATAEPPHAEEPAVGPPPSRPRKRRKKNGQAKPAAAH